MMLAWEHDLKNCACGKSRTWFELVTPKTALHSFDGVELEYRNCPECGQTFTGPTDDAITKVFRLVLMTDPEHAAELTRKWIDHGIGHLGVHAWHRAGVFSPDVAALAENQGVTPTIFELRRRKARPDR
jgi:hypothetical protein